jgi:hypothetical protein
MSADYSECGDSSVDRAGGSTRPSCQRPDVGKQAEGRCYGVLAMCIIGCAGPPTPSKIRMYHTLIVAPAFLASFTIGSSATVLR